MDTIQIRPNRRTLLLNIILVLVAVLGSSYALYGTDSFRLETKIFGTIANIVLLYFLFWPILRQLVKNEIELTADNDKLGFRNKDNWIEIKWTDIRNLEFNKGYDGYRMSKKMIVETTDGKINVINLNDLDLDWKDLQNKLNELNKI